MTGRFGGLLYSGSISSNTESVLPHFPVLDRRVASQAWEWGGGLEGWVTEFRSVKENILFSYSVILWLQLITKHAHPGGISSLSWLHSLSWGWVTQLASWAALPRTLCASWKNSSKQSQWDLLYANSTSSSWSCELGTWGSCWQHVLCFLVVLETNAGSQPLALGLSLHPVVHTPGHHVCLIQALGLTAAGWTSSILSF